MNKDFENGGSEVQLFLACMVGPFGVWIRWHLARLNGQGIGKDGVLKWVPFGTLAANVLAACVMAALATLKKAVILLRLIIFNGDIEKYYGWINTHMFLRITGENQEL